MSKIDNASDNKKKQFGGLQVLGQLQLSRFIIVLFRKLCNHAVKYVHNTEG